MSRVRELLEVQGPMTLGEKGKTWHVGLKRKLLCPGKL